MDNVHIEAWIAVLIRLTGIIASTTIGDGIARNGRKSINQVLRRIDSSLAIKAWWKVIGLLIQTKVPVFITVCTASSPKNLLWNGTRSKVINLRSLCKPFVTRGRYAAHAAYTVKHFGCIVGRFGVVDGRTCSKCRTGSKQRGLRTNGFCNATTDTSAHDCAENAIVFACRLNADGLIFGRNISVVRQVVIVEWEQLSGFFQVVINLIETLLERVTRLIEVIRGFL